MCIRDRLYVAGACSEASAEMVQEHLTACADCNAIYQKLLSHTSEDVLHEESESVIMRHEAKEKQRGRKKMCIRDRQPLRLCPQRKRHFEVGDNADDQHQG